nr:HAMP domain-containing sensor histidine kinase [Rhizomicrobium palustre]
MRAFPLLLNPLFLSQAALFVVLLVATLFSAARISRPLRRLARAAESLRPQEAFEPLAVEGPREVKVAITSFNSMALRVRELLTEKDRMLTAIGHDLRTPLASLRIRAENIEQDSEREKIIETVDEMTSMVEEILAFARLGYSTETRQHVDLSALADAVVEEFAAIGKTVAFIDSPRAPVMMQAGLMRRLIRNLIDNAVKYAGKAEVSVGVSAGAITLVVEDDGPGIPPDRLSDVLQPFSRLEDSRSRLTGGSGLGLSIADAIARSQGASLILENRASGGLRACVVWKKGAGG